MRRFGMHIPWVALVGLTACAPDQPASGAKLYRDNCVACHGLSGTGAGPLAADLPVAAADLTGLSARNGGEFPWVHVMATIHGYHGQDTQRLMPGFEAVLTGPTILWQAPDGSTIPTPQALLSLARYVETLQAS
ncbi:cytochrome c [Aestuariivita sp.]|jgi:mono/diheme cytochrome c family protein|uniref:c-type cytochrome n=1 Tax=Aestuariivita sp. TaxID=1872407 RepID=UPI002171A79C|nr:cytochrome c [Aestuariivita sp.]MCE8008440.1 cytochrome c [Aestuariivita sp.]